VLGGGPDDGIVSDDGAPMGWCSASIFGEHSGLDILLVESAASDMGGGSHGRKRRLRCRVFYNNCIRAIISHPARHLAFNDLVSPTVVTYITAAIEFEQAHAIGTALVVRS